MSDPATALQTLLGLAQDAPVTLTGMAVSDWGRTLTMGGQIGDQLFELRYTDCREFRWRVYVQEQADATPLVSFVPGRDHSGVRRNSWQHISVSRSSTAALNIPHATLAVMNVRIRL